MVCSQSIPAGRDFMSAVPQRWNTSETSARSFRQGANSLQHCIPNFLHTSRATRRSTVPADVISFRHIGTTSPKHKYHICIHHAAPDTTDPKANPNGEAMQHGHTRAHTHTHTHSGRTPQGTTRTRVWASVGGTEAVIRRVCHVPERPLLSKPFDQTVPARSCKEPPPQSRTIAGFATLAKSSRLGSDCLPMPIS